MRSDLVNDKSLEALGQLIMSIESILLIILIASVLVLALFLFRSRSKTSESVDKDLLLTVNDLRKEIQQSNTDQRKEVQEQLTGINEQLLKSLSDSSQTMQKQFKHTSSIVRDVTERLTKLDETNKQVLGFSEQLQSLENILKNPKQRGILGEYWLETLLSQVLQPTQYSMQHHLGNDEKTGQKLIPDAVLFVKKMLIPIDAKFSLENYNKISQESNSELREKLEKEFKSDVKKRIDETSKYVKPQMGTTNFAFMFVPAEGVYHNLITSGIGAASVNTRNLIEYAFEKGVMIVSPTSFYAYLQTVLLGLKALQIEESVKEIQKQAENMMRHLRLYEDYHNKVGKHLETTVRAFTASSRELKKVDKDVYKITDGAAGKQLEPLELDVPVKQEVD
jgi:DNA recombination protein RmuC